MNKKEAYTAVVVADDYKNIDGRNAYASNIKNISIGISDEEKNGVVLQIESDTNEISRIPFYQIIDLALVACTTKGYMQEAYHIKGADDKGTVVSRVGIQGDAMTLKVCSSKEEFNQLTETFVKNDEMLSERLSSLARLLREMRY